MKVEQITLPDGVDAYIQCADLSRVLLIGTDGSLLAPRAKMGGTAIRGFTLTVKDGDLWQDPGTGDDLAGANRTEARTNKVQRADGTPVTRVYDRTLLPASYPLYGHGDATKKQTLGQWYNGKKSRPVAFNRLEGDRESLLINAYKGNDSDRDNSLEVIYPFRYGTRRFVTTTAYYADGTMDLQQWVDGVQITNLLRHPVDSAGNLDDLHWKGGIYLRKGAGHTVNGMPDFTASYDHFHEYLGPAKPEDIGTPQSVYEVWVVPVGQGDAMPALPPAGQPPAPAPAPQPVPVTPVPITPVPVEEEAQPVPSPAQKVLHRFVDSIENSAKYALSEQKALKVGDRALGEAAVKALTAWLTSLK